ADQIICARLPGIPRLVLVAFFAWCNRRYRPRRWPGWRRPGWLHARWDVAKTSRHRSRPGSVEAPAARHSGISSARYQSEPRYGVHAWTGDRGGRLAISSHWLKHDALTMEGLRRRRAVILGVARRRFWRRSRGHLSQRPPASTYC